MRILLDEQVVDDMDREGFDGVAKSSHKNAFKLLDLCWSRTLQRTLSPDSLPSVTFCVIVVSRNLTIRVSDCLPTVFPVAKIMQFAPLIIQLLLLRPPAEA